MRKVFICYRRAEAEYAAGALGRELRRTFGDEQVFRDKEDMGGGASWKQQVLRTIDRESALLVLISRGWAEIDPARGLRRLDDPDDPIRMEIRDGMADGATVIPVLLENATMPPASTLPPELQPLAEFHALRLRDGDWQNDLARICATLERTGFRALAGRGPGAAPASPARGMSIKLVASYILGLMALIAFSGAEDRDTYHSVALFGVVAFILAGFSYHDYRRHRISHLWPTIGALAIGLITTVGGLGKAGELAVTGEEAAQSASAPPGGAEGDRVPVTLTRAASAGGH